MLKAEIYGTVNIWQPEYFGFFAAYIYVNSAQNHNFKQNRQSKNNQKIKIKNKIQEV